MDACRYFLIPLLVFYFVAWDKMFWLIFLHLYINTCRLKGHFQVWWDSRKCLLLLDSDKNMKMCFCLWWFFSLSLSVFFSFFLSFFFFLSGNRRWKKRLISCSLTVKEKLPSLHHAMYFSAKSWKFAKVKKRNPRKWRYKKISGIFFKKEGRESVAHLKKKFHEA